MGSFFYIFCSHLHREVFSSVSCHSSIDLISREDLHILWGIWYVLTLLSLSVICLLVYDGILMQASVKCFRADIVHLVV